ncbi:1,4-dihydroxy-2-naphthoate octaprenyltransferase [Magnetovibrio sp. PR-2]|uniref:1,4-dihydroxy-2-naphthoate octaprenyltransferase n=1 Tax=Magnetovibrio sp. PR-2 TaxID=3120356 RepID=UPI002FCDEC0F
MQSEDRAFCDDLQADKPTGLKLWWVAARPKTLGLAVSPVILATALALQNSGEIEHLEIPFIILLCAVAIQVGTNLFNDEADHANGTDNAKRLGPPRVTASGWALPHQVRIAGFLAFFIALCCGMYLAQTGGWPIAFGGLAALFAGYFYSHGPAPIAHTPMGEVAVLLSFGFFAVGGTVFLLIGHVPTSTYLWGGVLGLPAAAVLMLNNIRDMESDRRAGRRTLAILIGDTAARRLYAVVMLAPFVLIVGGVAVEIIGPGALFGFGAFFFTLKTIRAVRRLPSAPQLNPLLARTVLGQILLALSSALGVVLMPL